MSKKCEKDPFSEMVEVEFDDCVCSIQEMSTCWRCNGSGETPWKECQWCMNEAEDSEEASAKEREGEK